MDLGVIGTNKSNQPAKTNPKLTNESVDKEPLGPQQTTATDQSNKALVGGPVIGNNEVRKTPKTHALT